MKPYTPSISDIAKALGVSVSTVSRALKNHPDISAETRMRIQDFARQANYRPNALALGLKKQHSDTIGLIIPEIQHHFFSSVISGIEDLAYSSGYRVMICQSNEDYEREVINVQALFDHRVDGILVSVSKNTLKFDHFESLISKGIPVVFFDRGYELAQTDQVLTDDAGGAQSIVKKLVEKERRRILHLAAPQHLVVGRERFRGYSEALEQYGINPDPSLFMLCDTPLEVTKRKNQILELAGSIDGIFAVNDFTAIAVMQLLQENGYHIPEQIAVAGFGDDPIASIVRPALTTVEQKGFEMGREAISMLLHRIDNPTLQIEPQIKVFPTVLRVRQST